MEITNQITVHIINPVTITCTCACSRCDNKMEAIAAVAAKVAQSLGYDSLTNEQIEAVVHFVQGQDIFISLPTGAGKSLCYVILPLLFNTIQPGRHSIIIVVSPLKCLMQDQCTKYSEKGVKCICINEVVTEVKIRKIFLLGNTKLYTSVLS